VRYQISLAASCGFSEYERAPLMHMISDLNSEKLNVPNTPFDCITDATYQQVNKPIFIKSSGDESHSTSN